MLLKYADWLITTNKNYAGTYYTQLESQNYARNSIESLNLHPKLFEFELHKLWLFGEKMSVILGFTYAEINDYFGMD